MSSTAWVVGLDRQVPEDVARLLATVPEWFAQPESNEEYIEATRSRETWTVRNSEGVVVGVALIDRHFPHVTEVHLTAVGTTMLRAVENDAVCREVRLLQVKTFGASHPNPGYARTRHFDE